MTHDVIVIGAGPGGMSAAATVASLGLKTVLVDEQSYAGGQIYRNAAGCDPRVATLLGADYGRGAELAKALKDSGAEIQADTLVWDVARDLTVTALRAGRALQLRAPQLIACTGAMERASPISGWTLPGVMNVGAAQIAMKNGGAIPAGRIVLAGAGPLLLLVATQLQAAGADVAAVVETTPPGRRFDALPYLPSALRAWPALVKGLKMVRALRRSRVPWHVQATDLSVVGTDRVAAVRFKAAGRDYVVAADYVLVHHGVIPNTQLSRLLRLDHRWDERQEAWTVATGDFGQTSMAGLRMAGDGTAIAGARAAEAAGTLAALGAANALGRIDAAELSRRSRPFQRALSTELAIRPFLDVLYRPPRWIMEPADDTVVCRCEEVTAGRIREMARLGCAGPNQTKFFSRCGMGPCQGRICGNVVTKVLAAELCRPPSEVGAYRIRAPLKPVPLRALASMAAAPNATDSTASSAASTLETFE